MIKAQAKEKIDTAKSSWYLWLFPVIAIAISGWLLREFYKQRGPVIIISFPDGSSLQAEKTRVRFRGVTIGLVKKITISEDGKDVLAHVALQRDAEHFAVEGSKFWVVAPKVGLQGVSGLETLLEGTYIAVQPGPELGDEKLEFKGKLSNDSDASEETSAYYLEATSVESINPGDAITFRGLNVGTIGKVTLAKGAQTVLIQMNIKNAHVKLIRTNTVFWKKVGIQAKLGLFNSEVKVNSMDSILRGGVEFFTPDAPGEVSKANARFELSPAQPKGSEKWNPRLD